MPKRLARLVGLLIALGAGVALAAPAGEAYPALARFARAVAQVENGFVDAVDPDRLVDGALGGMMRALDPYSAWLPADRFQAQVGDGSARAGGVGVALRREGELLSVGGLRAEGPAARAGVQVGDRLLAVDGTSTFAMAPAEALTRLHGPPGSEVSVVLWRTGAGAPVAHTLVRAPAPAPTVTARRVGRVGVLRVDGFGPGTGEAVWEALGDHAGEDLVGWVLDLRGNPGGLVDEAVTAADAFLAGGPVVRTVGRDGAERVSRAHARTAVPSLPLRVLVDEGTASAAEVLAAALRDRDRALLLGRPTFGKASLQGFLPLGDGSGLKLTVARTLPPSGRSFEGRGLVPDHPVPAGPDPGGGDPLLALATRQLDPRDP